jgi:hypothetical protein
MKVRRFGWRRNEVAVIEEVDARLRAIASVAVPSAQISFGPPGDQPGVSAYLYDLLPSLPARGNGRAPLQFIARYLITAGAEDAEAAHTLLEHLAFAALESTDLEADFEPLPAAAWSAFGLAPRPSFFIDAVVQRPRAEPETPLVRSPLVVEISQKES